MKNPFPVSSPLQSRVIFMLSGIMKSRTSLITMRIIMFYLLSVVGRSTEAIEEASSSSLHMSRLHPLLNNLEFEEPQKKAYIAEYKRLPLFNFGVGKRWIDNNEDKVSF